MKRNDTYTRTQSILLAKIGDMSEDTKNAAEAGNINIEDQSYFKRVEISGKASLFNILKNDDSIEDGICNISKQKIDQGSNIAVDRISVKVATSTAEGASAGSVIYKDILQCTDPAVVNAELEVWVKQVKVFSAPLSEFTQEIACGHSQGCNINLTAPKLITDTDEIQLRVKFPEDATVSTASSTKTFLEVLLNGSAIRNK